MCTSAESTTECRLSAIGRKDKQMKPAIQIDRSGVVRGWQVVSSGGNDALIVIDPWLYVLGQLLKD